MADKLAAGVPGSAKRADRLRFLFQGALREHRHDERQHEHDDVQHRREHRLVVTHVVARELDRVVVVVLHEIVEHVARSADIAHDHVLDILCLVVAFLQTKRPVVVVPDIAVRKAAGAEAVKSVLRDQPDRKVGGVEHHIGVVLVQAAVVRQGDQAAHGQGAAAGSDLIADADPVVLRIQPVDGDLIVCLWKRPVQQARLVHAALFAHLVDADRVGSVGCFVQIELF